MKRFFITQETVGKLEYTVFAETEAEALQMVEYGEVDFDCHDWTTEHQPYVEREQTVGE